MHSCGTLVPLWSDDEHPTDIGVVHHISASRMTASICGYNTLPVDVMRCAEGGRHYIYMNLVGNHSQCAQAFCGMN